MSVELITSLGWWLFGSVNILMSIGLAYSVEITVVLFHLTRKIQVIIRLYNMFCESSKLFLIFRQDQTSLRCFFELACNIKTSFYSLASCHVVPDRLIVRLKWVILLSNCVKTGFIKNSEYIPFHLSMMFLHYIWSLDFKRLKKIINIQGIRVVWINFVLFLWKCIFEIVIWEAVREKRNSRENWDALYIMDWQIQYS